MQEHVDISHLSGFHTPARARYFVEYVGDISVLEEASLLAEKENLPILVVAGGQNMLFAFDEYPGIVVRNNALGFTIIQNTKDKQQNIVTGSSQQGYEFCTLSSVLCLHVQSGHSIWQLAEELENMHGINIWHRFQGLPGSIGGAVFGNAGCFGLEIGPYVRRVDIFDMEGRQAFSLTGEEMQFDYRWSVAKDHPEWFITAIVCDVSEMIEKYPAPAEDPLVWRARVQPKGYSCGSFFKNPSREQSAGFLIEQAGLKGYHHGGAYFSDQHANFLMSDGTATWQDLIGLIDLAQDKISALSGILLEPEVRIISSPI